MNAAVKQSYILASSNRFSLTAVLVLLSCNFPTRVTCLSLSVVLPLKNKYSQETQGKLRSAFHDIVDSSDLFEHNPSQDDIICCRAPPFGDDVIITLRPQKDVAAAVSKLESISEQTAAAVLPPPEEYILSFNGSSNEDEFGWICAKVYECRDSLESTMDLTGLRSRVIGHFNAQPPHPGYDAAAAAWSGSPQTKKLFADTAILKELEDSGFVVIESGPKTSTLQNDKLSRFLVEKTNQGDAVRRDTVHFLNQEDAYSCDLENQYEIMMSIASHLNDNLDFSASAYSPGYPATDSKPFTNPRMIQLAEYGKHDFYKIHSDNSFAQGGESSVRSNYRSYTCILYCNDNWTPAMGGALRLYPGSREFGTPEGAIASCEHVDINPLNGRLLIFDSCLTHSVEQVTQSDQTRRALTLWITRPNDSGVAGESFY